MRAECVQLPVRRDHAWTALVCGARPMRHRPHRDGPTQALAHDHGPVPVRNWLVLIISRSDQKKKRLQ